VPTSGEIKRRRESKTSNRRDNGRAANRADNRTSTSNDDAMHCELHKCSSHNTADCKVVINNPALMAFYKVRSVPSAQIHATTSEPSARGYNDDAHEDAFVIVTRATVTHQVLLAMGKRAEVAPKIDMWCVDGASSCNATYTEEGCYDIRPCHVRIESCNSSSEAFVCTRMGKRTIRALNEQTGEVVTMIADEVLIPGPHPRSLPLSYPV
jgi:hypothetical protein